MGRRVEAEESNPNPNPSPNPNPNLSTQVNEEFNKLNNDPLIMMRSEEQKVTRSLRLSLTLCLSLTLTLTLTCA